MSNTINIYISNSMVQWFQHPVVEPLLGLFARLVVLDWGMCITLPPSKQLGITWRFGDELFGQTTKHGKQTNKNAIFIYLNIYDAIYHKIKKISFYTSKLATEGPSLCPALCSSRHQQSLETFGIRPWNGDGIEIKIVKVMPFYLHFNICIELKCPSFTGHFQTTYLYSKNVCFQKKNMSLLDIG